MYYVIMNDFHTDKLLSPREACELIPGVGYQAFLNWLRNDKIPHITLPNGRKLVRLSDIEALLQPPPGNDSVSAGISNELPLF